MADLIERDKVIDALEKVAELFPWRVPGKRDTYDSYNEAWNDAIGRAEMEIENLPSAQLYTEEEIQKMQDLEQAELDKAFELGKQDAQPEPRWIPCSEPPKESGTYIVTAYDGADKRVTFVKYQKTLKRWDLTGARAYWRILAYKPLPEPWRGEEHEET